MMFELYFAMDIKNGTVVWGYKGEREKYEPIHLHSEIIDVSNPIEILKIVKPKKVYAADLDAIVNKDKTKKSKNNKILKEMCKMCELIVDRGFRTQEEIIGIPYTPILGSETYNLINVIDDVFVSLDFKDRLLDISKKLNLKSAIELLNTFKLKGVIVLDIKKVGTGNTNFRLIEKALEYSDNPIYAGGGVKDIDDLEKMKNMGVKGAIVATAIHKKRIPVQMLRG